MKQQSRVNLIKSFCDEYKRIEKRNSVWLQTPTGWFHSSNNIIVKWRLESLTEIINDLTRGNNNDVK